MIRASVKAFDNFGQLEETVDRKCVAALNDAAQEMASVAASVGASRGATDIKVIPAHGTADGFASGIAGRWYYRFLSSGTLGRALNPKRPGTIRSHAPGTGIEPNRMYQRARTAGRRRLIERLGR